MVDILNRKVDCIISISPLFLQKKIQFDSLMVKVTNEFSENILNAISNVANEFQTN
jgi:hypothetical protein